MSKGKRIRAKIHRSLREARDKEKARQEEIDFTIRLANLKPPTNPIWWYEQPWITQKDLDNFYRCFGVKE